MAVAAIGREQSPYVVVPLEARLSDSSVDLALNEDPEQRIEILGTVVDEAEPFQILTGRFGPPGGFRQRRAHRDEVRNEDPNRAATPGRLGDEEVRGSLIVLKDLPGQAVGEPIDLTSDRQAADDRAEVRPALRQIPFERPNVGMEPDGREVDVLRRASVVDPHRHPAVADKPFGIERDDLGVLGSTRQVRSDDRVLKRPVNRRRRAAPRDRSVMKPRADGLWRNRHMPMAVDAAILGPKCGQEPQGHVIDEQLQPDFLTVLDRMRSQNDRRPCPGANGTAVSSLGRRFDPSRRHS